MAGQNIQYPSNGQGAMGYLAGGDTKTPKMGLVVIQEWWGLNDHIREVTDRFAAAGFVALAPDLYHGKVVSEPNDAQKAVMELDRERAMKEIDGAVAHLKGLPSVTPKKIGVIGFCMGGGLALWCATRSPDVGAVASFYGGGAPSEADQFGKSNAAILCVLGELDTRVNGSIQPLAEGLKKAGKTVEVKVYPGAQHAFFNDTRPGIYNAEAAKDAWQQSLNWFKKYLTA